MSMAKKHGSLPEGKEHPLNEKKLAIILDPSPI